MTLGIKDYWDIGRNAISRLLRTIIFRTRNIYLQLAEILDHDKPYESKDISQIVMLPEVEVMPVEEEKEIKFVINLYYKNPSPMMFIPWKKEIFDERISDGVKFYLIYNGNSQLVGATGFDQKRNMFVSSIIDSKQRKKGYGKSMYLKLMDLKKKQGIHEFRAQIFKRNIRAKNMLLSIGFEIDSKEDNEKYFTMIKQFDV
jgi:RimJ/RimL family protein N-acetyltransferase